MRRLFPTFGAVLVASLCFAQSEVSESFTLSGGGATVVGTLYYVNDAATGQVMPTRAEVTATTGLPGSPSKTWAIGVRQTHTYAAGQYISVGSPVSIVTEMTGTSTTNRNVLGAFVTGLYTGEKSKQLGKYEFFCELRQSSTVLVGKTVYCTINRYASESGNIISGHSSGGGGVGANSDSEAAQNTFWQNLFESLFVPDPDNVDALIDTLDDFMTWGPFGIYSYLNSEITGPGTGRIDYVTPYKIPFSVPMVGALELDLTPYEGFIKFVRAIFAGVLWFLVVFAIWKRVYQKA